MILKASQRSGAKQLGLHLLKTEENEHVEVHEVSGFVAADLMGAMREAYALSRGTKCQQFLFSVSLNPPADEAVRTDVFEHACAMIEERLGLKGQPRIIVFHEKEGRRHAHAVWSRIEPETMTAKPLPFFKTKLRDIAKQLFLENGWRLPQGFVDSQLRDPRNFTLAEWQQAKRGGIDPKQVKAAIHECWAISDSPHAFAAALEGRGLFLAKGDRRGHVAVSVEGEVFSIARVIGKKGKEVTARLGSPDDLRSVSDTLAHISHSVGASLKSHIREAKRISANRLRPLHEQRDEMKLRHGEERRKLDAGQKARAEAEQQARASLVRTGLMGAWDFLTGQYAKVRKQNEAEAFFAFQRDREQRHQLLHDQHNERRELQRHIETERHRNAMQVLALYREAARLRRLPEQAQGRGLEPGR